MKVNPYTTKKESEVYHIYNDCKVGNNIEKENKVSGKGGRRLCSTCIQMSKT